MNPVRASSAGPVAMFFDFHKATTLHPQADNDRLGGLREERWSGIGTLPKDITPQFSSV